MQQFAKQRSTVNAKDVKSFEKLYGGFYRSIWPLSPFISFIIIIIIDWRHRDHFAISDGILYPEHQWIAQGRRDSYSK